LDSHGKMCLRKEREGGAGNELVARKRTQTGSLPPPHPLEAAPDVPALEREGAGGVHVPGVREGVHGGAAAEAGMPGRVSARGRGGGRLGGVAAADLRQQGGGGGQQKRRRVPVGGARYPSPPPHRPTRLVRKSFPLLLPPSSNAPCRRGSRSPSPHSPTRLVDEVPLASPSSNAPCRRGCPRWPPPLSCTGQLGSRGAAFDEAWVGGGGGESRPDLQVPSPFASRSPHAPSGEQPLVQHVADGPRGLPPGPGHDDGEALRWGEGKAEVVDNPRTAPPSQSLTKATPWLRSR